MKRPHFSMVPATAAFASEWRDVRGARRTRVGAVLACTVAMMTWMASTPSLARAACGELDCGPRGSCDERSLLARCNCDTGYFSLRVKIGQSSLGAYCVPEPAPLDAPGCDVARCEPHGTCMLDPAADAGGASCRCDVGYRLDEEAGCIDAPDDEREAVCDGVLCGEGNYCLPTPQGPTCRCLRGGSVALGAAEGDAFGPVCTNPPNPATACGPDACGPYGRCVISQAARCACDDGAEVQMLTASDGKQRPYCVDPNLPWPPELPTAAGVTPEPTPDPGSDAGTDGGAVAVPDGGVAERPGAARAAGCNCRASRRDGNDGNDGNDAAGLAILALLATHVRRRSARRSTARLIALRHIGAPHDGT